MDSCEESKRLNDALKMFNPLFIIPLLQVSFILFAIISGGIFFQEFNLFDMYQWFGFCFGIIVMFSGLVLLTPQLKNTNDDELQQKLVSLLLETRSITSKSPRSHCPTPCQSVSGNEEDTSEVEGLQHQSHTKESIASSALHAVKDVLCGDPSAMTLSEAMILNTLNEDNRKRRRDALHRLLELIKDNPISTDGYSLEITSLMDELKLDIHDILLTYIDRNT